MEDENHCDRRTRMQTATRQAERTLAVQTSGEHQARIFGISLALALAIALALNAVSRSHEPITIEPKPAPAFKWGGSE